MTSKRTIFLIDRERRARAHDAIDFAPDGWVCVVQEPTRSLTQNARYWSNGVLAQIARKASVNGKYFSAEVWHEMFKRIYIGVEELPDGTVSSKSSAKLGKKAFAEFCTQVEAYAATELGVEFHDLEDA